MIPTLKFAHNKHHKLNCDVFSTIRLWDEAKHFKGKLVELWDTSGRHNTCKGKAEYLLCQPFFLDELKEGPALLDTGCSLKQTKEILYSCYPEAMNASMPPRFAYIILRKVKEVDSQGEIGF